jgi:menaquinone-9 beta-reductase
VLLLDAGTFPRHKVCGEFFSAEAVGVLASLLGDDHPLLRHALEIETVRLQRGDVSTAFPLRSPALSISRFDLDHALWQQAISIGVLCRERTRVLAATRSEVRTDDGVFAAHAVINASGRWSELSATHPSRSSRLIGIKAHFETTDDIPAECTLHFFDGGYVGVQPVARQILNVSALVDAKRYRDMTAVLRAAQLQHEHWRTVYEPITCAPVRFAPPSPVRDGVLQCGDAAAFIDPFAGDGMSLALHSGVLAAEHALSHTVNEYAKQYTHRFSSAFRSAAWMRKLAFGAPWLQSVGIRALRIPALANLTVATTRAS